MSNTIEQVPNSGCVALQSATGTLMGITKDKDKEIGDPNNISLTAAAGIKIKSVEEMITVCEESITNICKNSNVISATSIKQQARSEFAVETGATKRETLFRMVSGAIKLTNFKGATIDLLLGGVNLLMGPSKITVTAAGITLSTATETIEIGGGAGNAITCKSGNCTTTVNSSGSTCTVGGCTSTVNSSGSTCTVGGCTTSTTADGSTCTVGGETMTMGANGLDCTSMPCVGGVPLTDFFAAAPEEEE
ncbi:MAG: hypothetical protein J7L15_07315 [Clostridiales bacterium]|nr:hypothetical protein [Clostridiales bacterium]